MHDSFFTISSIFVIIITDESFIQEHSHEAYT